MNRQQRRAAERQAHSSGPARPRIDVAGLFERGFADHQAGRLRTAEAAYRHVLATVPDHADALHMLGVIAHQLGRHDVAIGHIRQSLALHGANPQAHSNLAGALRALGRLAEAEASCREALIQQPDLPGGYYNLGIVLNGLGRLDEAEASYREALRRQPDLAEVHYSLGNVLRDRGRLTEAAVSFRDAVRLRPDYPEALFSLGTAMRELGQLNEAEACLRAALRLRPGNPQAHIDLGIILCMLERQEDALTSYREALRLQPNHAAAHGNLGMALYSLARPAEAAASFREALRLRPEHPEGHADLGIALLLAGLLEEGWHEYEWRWKTRHLSGDARNFTMPQWCGERIGDRTILLHAEQGLGDTLQFCRYVPLISAARIVLEVQEPLIRLMSGLAGVTTIVARGDALPPFDLHCPLMSLPHAFGTTLDTIPAATPYLLADPVMTATWRERLAGLGGFRVGLVWSGGQRLDAVLAATGRRRSISLDAMAPLAAVPGVSFISLQKGEPAAQAANPPHGMVLHDFTADLHDFADTAALVECLDLVISVDTSVAHLAGALGKPVWLLNRVDTSWRWLLHREDSPWYPRLRQFRQPSPGDWSTVIHRVRAALQRLAAGDHEQ